ncbi:MULTISPECIES: efflux RND transporter periplasmic adaptor subunit [unclassified Ensifer]|uniref:efflux RND transporter periplasmic adaptor subunit n=1 Tax=unclassified Ensifer TaxID=2633371 RepID=UPI00081395E7|nr:MULTISPECIES: efflux RND transporter periplasmic adaptor subunit [unclassified Ensifer]OCO99909.1 efflux transporter periplasmic adaptor subunit [Ensifer sp. LC13]OCP00149.1 efflux transporter periplasmic adaptor subunit [Ensifer sp. LC11]OCP03995.1 efflux transporter periplasmic adaptor subunit [Ensifer sp. LC14]OCP31042.1 efflux transporter periplasmic adaptor subunit [Ensifer sp. LC499]
MRLARYAAGAVTIVAIGAAVSWYLFRPTPVFTIIPKRGDAAEIIYADGVVEPRTWAKVTPTVAERIVEQCDCEGERVGKGDVLARLDDTEARAALGELQARLTLAQEEYRRKVALAERRTISEQEVDRARSELGQLEALVAGRQARLATYVLRAPSAGQVLRQDGEIGEVADLGTVLFWVGEPRPLIVTADVNEEDIPRVEVGQKALLRSDAFRDRKLEATVDSITPKGDPVTKTYRVRFRLPDDTPLRIGMSTDVNIIVRVSHDALIIPTVALEGTKIAVVDGNRAKIRDLKTGIRGADGVEILSGLEDETRIISPFPTGLADGTRVKATPAPGD